MGVQCDEWSVRRVVSAIGCQCDGWSVRLVVSAMGGHCQIALSD